MPVPEVDVHQLASELQAGAVLLDVRNPDEWQAARVPGVPLIPLGELAGRLADVPAGQPLYVICAAGVRSARAAELLSANGVEAINVAGGTKEWVAAGYPTESGPG
jgi:rhodanese-related sulfurtransferase